MKIRCYYSFIVIFAGIGAEGAPQIDNSILSDVAVDTTNPESVLIAQMDDMQTGSTLVAYQLASPGNRAFTARPSGYNLERFDRMVHNDLYASLLSGHGYEVEEQGFVDRNNNQYFAKVKVFKTADQQSAQFYRFTMSIQDTIVVDEHESLGQYKLISGHVPVWRTDSVLIE